MNEKQEIRDESEKVMKNSGIAEFMELAQGDMESAALSFKTIKQHRYMGYWKNFIISEYVEDLNTFRFIYYGTELAKISEFDWTGGTLADNSVDTAFNDVFEMDLDIINNRSVIYCSGNFKFVDKEYIKWFSVSLPVVKASGEVLCLTYCITA